jgi:hypothetical protein
VKVAILGPGPAALEMTADLVKLGASVRLFWKPELESELEKQFYNDDILVPAPWHQVTKRFLLPSQIPKNRSRFADLFRVTYQVNPEGVINQGLVDQPEVYEKLSQEFLSSLKSRLDFFEDFDVVIDGSQKQVNHHLGPGGPAVGESRLREGTVYFSDQMTEYKKALETVQEVAVIGDGAEAAKVVTNILDWWRDPTKRIFLVSLSAIPFESFFKESSQQIEKVKEMMMISEREIAADKKEYEQKMAEWNELDDFVKVKKTKPELAIPRLVIFSGHILTAVDQLVDKSRSFLTIEVSPWGESLVQQENSELDLKTIGVDLIIGATGTSREWSRFYGLDLLKSADGSDSRQSDGSHPEIGFFTLGYEDNKKRREAIMNHLTNLFSPKGQSV